MSYRDQTLALAGMFQAGDLVRQVAREGNCVTNDFVTAVNSILKTDAPTTEAVYGGPQGVKHGLELLAELYTPMNKQRDMEVTQYVLGIAHLEKKLHQHPDLLNKLTSGIERANSQAEMFSPTHENVIANLADIYSNTISTLTPRIIVNGEQGYLNDAGNAAKVRTLLLALMRSAVLWRQKGGRRWQFLFSRKKIMSTANELLREC
ncbi:MAG: high frequency lysogenization protein HflD [Gammaproteobacteria bacterium]|nr:high frequency lysogenization protein HflD [Gammaproteobacteria bacterium]